MPAAGPDPRLRAGGEPLRRGEAAFREADPDLRPGAARPGALHPVRPLHPLLRGDLGRPAHRVHGPRQPMQVLTFPGEPFSSYFSGNTVQICPVGALPPKPYRFKARPWDLEAVESVSLVDSVGSKVSVQSSQNSVVRIDGVDNDRHQPGLALGQGSLLLRVHQLAAAAHHASGHAATASCRRRPGARRSNWSPTGSARSRATAVAGLGGARNTNEEAFAFGKFLRTVVVTPHIDAQLGDGLDPQFLAGVTPRATIDDLEPAKTILLWGPDLKEEYPVLYLRVRRAATELGATLIVVHPRRTGLHDVATHTLRLPARHRPRCAAGARAGGPQDYGSARQRSRKVRWWRSWDAPGWPRIPASPRPSPPSPATCPAARSCRSPGGQRLRALDMGLAPTLLPGRVSETGARAQQPRGRLGAAPREVGPRRHQHPRRAARRGFAGPGHARHRPGPRPSRPTLARAALEAADFVVAFDLFLSDSAALADVVLPVDGFAEVEGTVTNLEGRVQKVNRLAPRPRPDQSGVVGARRPLGRMGGMLGADSAAALQQGDRGRWPPPTRRHLGPARLGRRAGGLRAPHRRRSPAARVHPGRSRASLRSRPGSVSISPGCFTTTVSGPQEPVVGSSRPGRAAYLHPPSHRGSGLHPGSTGHRGRGAGQRRPARSPRHRLGDGTVYVPANLPRDSRARGGPVAVTVTPGG